MSELFGGVLFGFLFGVLLTLMIASVISEEQDDWWRKELTRRGHAHFYIDGNQNRQWNWKTNP